MGKSKKFVYKRFQNTMNYVGLGFFLLGITLFFVLPYLAKVTAPEGAMFGVLDANGRAVFDATDPLKNALASNTLIYEPFDAIKVGLMTLINTFKGGEFIHKRAYVYLGCIAGLFLCFFVWLILIIVKKHKSSIFWFVVYLLVFAIALLVGSAYGLTYNHYEVLIASKTSADNVTINYLYLIDRMIVGSFQLNKPVIAPVVTILALVSLVSLGISILFPAINGITEIAEMRHEKKYFTPDEYEEKLDELREQRDYAIDHNKELSENEIKEIIMDEINKKYPQNTKPVDNAHEEYIDGLINQLGMFKKKAPVKEETVVKEKVVYVQVEKPVEQPTVQVVEQPKPVIERIPFETRMLSAAKDLKANYNELKSEILSYGVKSRISNSGDTFRLHTKTYVKMTVAGKGLKLYLALDPKDYKDSTYPFSDASSKNLYEEIPFVFKVKSDLSVRRAKQLIADAMAKDGLEKGEFVKHDWVKELKQAK